MPWSRHSRLHASSPEPRVEYDDGGSGLLEACRRRFDGAGCVITCDASHTVWVKRADGARSVGLPPWQLRRHALDELLDDVDEKLGLTTPAR